MNEQTDRDARPGPQPSLDQSLRNVGKAGKDGLTSALSTVRALRSLVVADFALARVSLARALAWMVVAGVFGVCSWLLLMGALIALLQRLGLSWLSALSIPAAMSLAVTALGVFQTLRYFGYTRMEATRRQLALMGIGEDEQDQRAQAGDEPAAPQPQSGLP